MMGEETIVLALKSWADAEITREEDKDTDQ